MKKESLTTLSSSSKELTELEFIYKGKTYTIDLYRETQINPVLINEQLKEHSSSYYFLLKIRNLLENKKDSLEAKMEYTEKKMYIKYKEEKSDLTGRPNNDDLAKAKAIVSKEFREAQKEFRMANSKYKDVRDAIRAYESRKDILQTMSANIRNER